MSARERKTETLEQKRIRLISQLSSSLSSALWRTHELIDLEERRSYRTVEDQEGIEDLKELFDTLHEHLEICDGWIDTLEAS